MKKILIIEDDAQLQTVYKTLLTAAGYDVLIESGGHKGLSVVRTQLPALVILDIMLPDGINGFDILEQIKILPETKQIPVIVLTNLDTEANTAEKIGADKYLVKVNTSNEELLTAVKSLIG